jgi:nucleoside phosphorylase
VYDIVQYADPATVVLLGVAAGDRNRVRLGDVVIPQAVHFYDPERVTDAGSEPRHERLLVPTDMRANLHYYDPAATGLDQQIRAFSRRMSWRDRPRLLSGFRPRVLSHNAVIASGAKLLVDGRFLPQLRSRHDQRLVACDQESWGFAKGSEGLWWAIFRGISDHGDPQKDDRWQYLAAVCAALCLRNFLETEYLPPEAPRRGRGGRGAPDRG